MTIQLTDNIPTFAGTACADTEASGAIVRTKNARIAYTADINLAASYQGTNFTASDFFWTGNLFLVTSSSYYSTSTDGDTWTSIGVNKFAGAGSYGGRFATDGAGKVVCVDNNSFAGYSTDGGATWTTGVTMPLAGVAQIAYCNGMFIAANTTTSYVYSTNGGASWSSVQTKPTGNMLVASENMFLIGSDSSIACAYSTDGLSWTTGPVVGFGVRNMTKLPQRGVLISHRYVAANGYYWVDTSSGVPNIVYIPGNMLNGQAGGTVTSPLIPIGGKLLATAGNGTGVLPCITNPAEPAYPITPSSWSGSEMWAGEFCGNSSNGSVAVFGGVAGIYRVSNVRPVNSQLAE